MTALIEFDHTRIGVRVFLSSTVCAGALMTERAETGDNTALSPVGRAQHECCVRRGQSKWITGAH